MSSENNDKSAGGAGGGAMALSWFTTMFLGYVGAGGLLILRVEGVDMSLVGKTLGIAALVSLAASVVLTVRWARDLRREPGAPRVSDGFARRRFLTGAGAVIGGVVASAVATFARGFGWFTVTVPAILNPEVVTTDPDPKAAWKGSKIASYRRLGRTEFRVSDISLGSGHIDSTGTGEAIARAAIERGVNYFDTAPDYSAEGSELALGRAMKGQREKMFLATKFCTPQGHLPTGSSVEDYMAVVEGSLRRLQTDYVDLVHVHSCDTVGRLLDPNMHEAFERLREQGKAKFLGVSTHTPKLETIANTAIDDGRFDVLMLAYHHGAWPELANIVDRAAAKDVGIVAMKTLKGAKHRGIESLAGESQAYSQAAFKWVLANPSVSCLVISFYEHQHVDEYLYASGKKLDDGDLALLRRYDDATASINCLPHCDDCLDSCPEKLAINDVLRHRMYFEDYGREKYAMQLYAKLDKQADVCIGCSAPCAGACPHGLNIRTRTTGAHRLLNIA